MVAFSPDFESVYKLNPGRRVSILKDGLEIVLAENIEPDTIQAMVDNEVEEFLFLKAVREGEYETFIFQGKGKILLFFITAETLQDTVLMDESRYAFVGDLNMRWSNWLEDNKLRLLMDYEYQETDIAFAHKVKFTTISTGRTLEGYYGEPYMIDRFDVGISMDGKKGTISHLPDFDAAENTWELDAYIEYKDTPEGRLWLEPATDFVKYFGLKKEQYSILNNLWMEFHLDDIISEFHDVQVLSFLENQKKLIQSTLKDGFVPHIGYSKKGIEVIITKGDKTVEKYTRYADIINF